MKILSSLFAFLLVSFTLSVQSIKGGDVRLQLEKANQMLEQGEADGDQEKSLLLFTDDATFKVNGKGCLKGSRGILAAHQPLMDQGIKLKLGTDEVIPLANDYAYMSGDYALFAPNGQPVDQGKYATL